MGDVIKNSLNNPGSQLRPGTNLSSWRIARISRITKRIRSNSSSSRNPHPSRSIPQRLSRFACRPWLPKVTATSTTRWPPSSRPTSWGWVQSATRATSRSRGASRVYSRLLPPRLVVEPPPWLHKTTTSSPNQTQRSFWILAILFPILKTF